MLFAGLKGAVPILLGIFLITARVPGAERLYSIVAVVVVFSVVVQGSLVPAIARLLRVQMRVVEPEPWALGVRLRDEPAGVQEITVRPGSPADGATIGELAALPEDAWVSFVVRAGRLVPISGAPGCRPATMSWSWLTPACTTRSSGRSRDQRPGKRRPPGRARDARAGATRSAGSWPGLTGPWQHGGPERHRYGSR